jgi:PIN domain nuclease of toxin-antitoxin system
MKYLLDTHTLLWYLENAEQPPISVKNIILNINAKIYVSIVSFWEIAIKLTLRKLNLEIELSEIFRVTDENSFIILPVEKKHIESLINLPFYHRDPFDRLLISTAMSENATMLTKDENIQKYDLQIIW